MMWARRSCLRMGMATVMASVICWWLLPMAAASSQGANGFFDHLQGATPERGIDFFTREPKPSELTIVANILAQLNSGQISLEQANRGMPTGVIVRREPVAVIEAINQAIRSSWGDDL